MTEARYWHDDDLRVVAEAMATEYPEFDHLGLIDIRYLLTTADQRGEGCRAYGSVRRLSSLVSAVAAVPSTMRAQSSQDVNAVPRRVVVICLNSLWWQTSSDELRRPLVHHFLSHIDIDGAIQGHSASDHFATVRRFGAWNRSLEMLNQLFIYEAEEA